jgi:hypothetical protein
MGDSAKVIRRQRAAKLEINADVFMALGVILFRGFGFGFVYSDFPHMTTSV